MKLKKKLNFWIIKYKYREEFDEIVEENLKKNPLKKGESLPLFDYDKYSDLL